MNRFACLTFFGFSLILGACSKEESSSTEGASLRIARHPGGGYALVLENAPADVRAVEVEFSVGEGGAFELDNARAPERLPLDTVRAAKLGAHRAILFAGDKRGAQLPSSGTIAAFDARPSSSASEMQLAIARSVVSLASGERVDVAHGPAITLR